MASHETPQTPRPALDTAAVRIDYLTTEPGGMTVDLKGMGRRALNTALDATVGLITTQDAGDYRKKLQGDSVFMTQYVTKDESGNPVRRSLYGDYLEARDNPATPAEELAQAWSAYKNKVAPSTKVGIRNLSYSQSTNRLTGNAINTPFALYELHAGPDSSSEILNYSEPAASAMVVTTADNQLIIQHRAIERPRMTGKGKVRGNGQFADVPGVSVAGMLDAKPSQKPGVPQDVDTEFIMAGIMKEAGEELGLGPEHLTDQRIVGVATDKTKVHKEFLFSARTHLTAEELNEVSRLSNKNKDLGDADFEEKFMTIEASPKKIRTLLTEVKCPLPPTHAAAIFAAGYSMVLESDGPEAADQWRAMVESEMNQNTHDVNQRVANHFNRFPEEAERVPERFWGKRAPKRNPNGYSPAHGPEEQGLPALVDELVRTGLLPETRQEIHRGHLYDVDGVLTDPHDKRVIHTELYAKLNDQLKAGEPICLNTGRSAEWALENVVKPLAAELGEDNKAQLKLLSIVGEKGGSWITFNEAGEMNRGYAEALTLPNELVQQFDELLASDSEYSQMMTLAVDPYKKTMISPEISAIPEGVSRQDHLARFHKAQIRFAEQAKQLLEQAGMSNLFEVDKTTIATDIQSPHAGKDLGATRFIEILKAQDINFQNADFTTYGDSPSDIAMTEELERRNLSAAFVYVGKKPLKLSSKDVFRYKFPVTNMGNYTKGTLEYLER